MITQDELKSLSPPSWQDIKTAVGCFLSAKLKPNIEQYLNNPLFRLEPSFTYSVVEPFFTLKNQTISAHHRGRTPYSIDEQNFPCCIVYELKSYCQSCLDTFKLKDTDEFLRFCYSSVVPPTRNHYTWKKFAILAKEEYIAISLLDPDTALRDYARLIKKYDPSKATIRMPP